MRASRAITVLAAGLTTAALFAPPVLSYDEMAVNDGGTIQGKVVFNGTVPTKKIIPTKDSEVCGSVREEPVVMVGPDNGVLEAVVYLKEVAKGKAWGDEVKPVLDQEKCRFIPHVQVMHPGTLEVVNSDPVLHNTHGFYGRRTAFNLALPNEGQRIDTDLSRTGLVRVECDAHGWMLAWIHVADNPYYTLSAEDGSFSITDVPPGTYTLVAWQEHTGPVETEVTVAAGETAEVDVELKK